LTQTVSSILDQLYAVALLSTFLERHLKSCLAIARRDLIEVRCERRSQSLDI